jgi:hypothetical protein
LLLAGFAFFSGWQFALFVDPENFRVAGYALGFVGTFLLLFSAATSKRGA